MRWKTVWFFLIAAIWAVCLTQLPAREGPVYVTASFVDKNHLFIENLSREEVSIYEDGHSRDIEFMAGPEVPDAYGILFDLAMIPPEYEENSMSRYGASDSALARMMAYELIDKQLGAKTLWVGAYDRELHVVQDFTPDGFRAKEAISKLHGGRNPDESFLYSALVAAVNKMNERQERRRVLIVFLGTLDMETAGKLKPLKNLLSASNVELFFVSFAPRLSRGGVGLTPQMSDASLRELAGATAGDVFLASGSRLHPDDITRPLFNHIRTFYTFGFTSTSTAGKPSRLKIECKRPGSTVKAHPQVPALR